MHRNSLKKVTKFGLCVFRGRSILSKAGEVLLRFANDLEKLWQSRMPALEGKKMFLYIAPKKDGCSEKSQRWIVRNVKVVSKGCEYRQNAVERKKALKQMKLQRAADF